MLFSTDNYLISIDEGDIFETFVKTNLWRYFYAAIPCLICIYFDLYLLFALLFFLVLCDFMYDHEEDYEEDIRALSFYTDASFRTGAQTLSLLDGFMDLDEFEFMHGFWDNFDRDIIGRELMHEYLKTHVYSKTDVFPDFLKVDLFDYINKTFYLRHSFMMYLFFGDYLTYSDYKRIHTINDSDVFDTSKENFNYRSYSEALLDLRRKAELESDDINFDALRFIELQRYRQNVYYVNTKGFYKNTDVDFIYFLDTLGNDYSWFEKAVSNNHLLNFYK